MVNVSQLRNQLVGSSATARYSCYMKVAESRIRCAGSLEARKALAMDGGKNDVVLYLSCLRPNLPVDGRSVFRRGVVFL
jgi:hypothetical protein